MLRTFVLDTLQFFQAKAHKANQVETAEKKELLTGTLGIKKKVTKN